MTEIEEVELQIDENKKQIALSDAAQRLINNPDYRLLIEEHYCRDECARYVHGSINAGLSEAIRENMLEMARATGFFRMFMVGQIQLGNRADQDIVRNQKLLEELRQEED